MVPQLMAPYQVNFFGATNYGALPGELLGCHNFGTLPGELLGPQLAWGKWPTLTMYRRCISETTRDRSGGRMMSKVCLMVGYMFWFSLANDKLNPIWFGLV